MAHVFISYKSKTDSVFAGYLEQQIQNAGFASWRDVKIPAGKKWRDVIDDAIRSSLAVVVIVTSEARKSDYVTYEWAFALGLGKEVIPIWLDGDGLHPKLEELQHLDFRLNQNWSDLIERLQQIQVEYSSQEPIRLAEKQFDDPDPRKRYEAVMSLGQMAGIAKNEALARGVSHSYRDVRLTSAFQLAQVSSHQDKRAISGLTEALSDTDWQVRRDAAKVLGNFSDVSVIQPLIQRVNDTIGDVQWAVVEALGKIGDSAAIPALEQALSSSFSIVRSVAIDSLVMIGNESSPILKEVSQSRGYDLRIQAIEGLGRLRAEENLLYLTSLLRDQSYDIRRVAVKAHEYMLDDRAVPPLIEVLSDKESEVYQAAMSALQKFGTTAVPALEQKLNDGDLIGRLNAIETLGRIKEPTSLPTLIHAMYDEELSISNTAGIALRNFRELAVPSLLEEMYSSKARVRAIACRLLGEFGEQKAIPGLIENLKYQDARVRAMASKALGELKAAQNEAVCSLIELLDDNERIGGNFNESVADFAGYSLDQIGTPEARAAVDEWKKQHQIS